jgi:hypothetical protein
MAFKEKIEETIKLYPPHSFITFLSAVKINEEAYEAPQISALIVSNKSPVIISKLKCFMIEDYIEQEQETGKRFSLKLYLKVNKLLAVILQTICQNFWMYA